MDGLPRAQSPVHEAADPVGPSHAALQYPSQVRVELVRTERDRVADVGAWESLCTEKTPPELTAVDPAIDADPVCQYWIAQSRQLVSNQTPGFNPDTWFQSKVMPRPEKWADFKLDGRVVKPHKQHGRWEETYAQFKCPYECDSIVELQSDSVKNNKSTECHKHLMTCTGVTSDGKRAEDDERVRDARKASVKCAETMRAAKRGRVEDASGGSSDTTLALREQIDTLVASEGRLIAKNDGLRNRVSVLEEQMSEQAQQMREQTLQMQHMLAEMKQMREEVTLLRPLRSLVRRIGDRLGITSTTPPIESDDLYIDKIEGLKKAAAVREASGSSDCERHKRELNNLHAQIGELNKKNREAKDIVRCFAEYAKNPTEAKAFLRKISKATHPDKHGGKDTVEGSLATGLQAALNIVLTSIRGRV